ncbi:MAG TPA: N-6 DNA methylase [Candidatus Eisenbacteria bacterium]|jgi:hypothetical protein
MTTNIIDRSQLDLDSSAKAAAYKRYYQVLTALREDFHSTGRFDDSNAKLDEIVKLIVLLVHERERTVHGSQDRLTESWLRESAQTRFGDESRIAQALRSLSEEVLQSPRFQNPDGTCLFGNHPSLNIQPTDDRFALTIVRAIRDLLPANPALDSSAIDEFDVLNESFGHFVRDSFRSNIEDAQYMTPPEVVTAMVDMALSDIKQDADVLGRLLEADAEEPFRLLDPTCGVGSFLVQGLRALTDLIDERLENEAQREATRARIRDNVYGQDKVDRMVRLAKLNLMLFGEGPASVWQGNSILGGSKIDDLDGKVDLILTNPPFSARHSIAEVLRTGASRRYPVLSTVMRDRQLQSVGGGYVDSELLLLDRCLSLLRPGGRLLIVLPDSAISASGLPSAIRAAVGERAELLAVVELPAVTFAQAGTRTKTCFAYLRRPAAQRPTDHPVFMAVCSDLGFRVVARTGVQVKIHDGVNQLPDIVQAYTGAKPQVTVSEVVVAREEPSAVWIPAGSLLNGRWTPNFYQARRLSALKELDALGNGFGVELVRLTELAKLASRGRRQAPIPSGSKCISVLHVTADGTLDFGQIESYTPKGMGLPCRPGEVLISRINPHIPRVCVVPDDAGPLTCSTEFEILEPTRIDAFLLAALLGLPQVQAQIECLTSGTSSSHSRIKDAELGEVLLPVPRTGSPLAERVGTIAGKLRQATGVKYAAERTMRDARAELGSLFYKR